MGCRLEAAQNYAVGGPAICPLNRPALNHSTHFWQWLFQPNCAI